MLRASSFSEKCEEDKSIWDALAGTLASVATDANAGDEDIMELLVLLPTACPARDRAESLPILLSLALENLEKGSQGAMMLINACLSLLEPQYAADVVDDLESRVLMSLSPSHDAPAGPQVANMIEAWAHAAFIADTGHVISLSQSSDAMALCLRNGLARQQPSIRLAITGSIRQLVQAGVGGNAVLRSLGPPLILGLSQDAATIASHTPDSSSIACLAEGVRFAIIAFNALPPEGRGSLVSVLLPIFSSALANSGTAEPVKTLFSQAVLHLVRQAPAEFKAGLQCVSPQERQALELALRSAMSASNFDATSATTSVASEKPRPKLNLSLYK